MKFLITNNGKDVEVVNSITEVSRYMTTHHPNVKSWNRKTIKRNINNGFYRKNGFQIEQLDDDSRRKILKEVDNTKLKMLGSSTFITIKNNLIANHDNKFDIIMKIIKTIRAKDNEQKIKRTTYRIVLHKDEGAVSTTFIDFNLIYDKTINLIDDLLLAYNQEFLLRKIVVQRMNRPNLRNVAVYGSEKQKQISYGLLCEAMTFSPDSKRRLCELSRGYEFHKPMTKKSCLVMACFMSALNEPDYKKVQSKCKEFRKTKTGKFDKHTIDNVCPQASRRLKKQITVYFLDYDIQIFKYNYMKYEDNINIVIYEGHAIACIDVNTIKKEENQMDNMMNVQTLYEVEDYKNKYEDYTIAVYDLETCDADMEDKKKHDTHVYALGYYDGFRYKEIYNMDHEDVLEEFINFLLTLGNKTIIYAHNGGKFDTYLLLKVLLKSSKVNITNFLEQNGRIMQMTITVNKNTIIFRDSYNLIATSLDKACKDFKTKTKKLEGDVDHSKINMDNCKTEEIYNYTKKYLKNDCLSLHEALMSFDNILDNAYGFSIKNNLTNAGIARSLFKNKFYDEHKTPIYSLTREVDTELRKFYYGGRNEVMTKLGHTKGKLFYLDFTSLYPYVMQNNEYQYGKMNIIDVKTKIFNKKWFGFVKCRFRNTHKKNIPLHPVVILGRLVFPHVKKWQDAILSTEEVRYSVKNDIGYEYEFTKVYNYENKTDFFKKPVEELYKMKIDAQKEGNKALRSISKIIINSLYGFFGIKYLNRDQTVVVNERCSKTKRDGFKNAEDNREKRLGGYLMAQKLKDFKQIGKYDFYKVIDEIDVDMANVGIASTVTAYARLELYKLLKDIKDRKGNIYYMDTDSVVTDYNIYADREMRKKWIRTGGDKLGELTNETEIDGGYYKELVTLGNKMYALKNNSLEKNSIVLKMKGINSKMKYDKKIICRKTKNIKLIGANRLFGKECITFDDYKRISKGYNITCDNMSFRSGINDMIIKEKGLEKILNDKTISRLYDKASVDKEGYITPLII